MIDFRTRAFVLILAAALVLVTAGCGSSDDDASSAAGDAKSGMAESGSAKGMTQSANGVTTRIAAENETVELPDGYPAGFPVYPGAKPTFSQDTNAAASVAFQTEDPGTQVYEYFSKQLPSDGWNIKNDTQLGGKFLLTAEKDGREVSLFIPQSSEGMTSILLMSKT